MEGNLAIADKSNDLYAHYLNLLVVNGKIDMAFSDLYKF